jgi:hypothetical protein
MIKNPKAMTTTIVIAFENTIVIAFENTIITDDLIDILLVKKLMHWITPYDSLPRNLPSN